MTDYVRLGMVLPEEGGNDVSWTPVDRKMYSQDMRLSGDDLLRQVEADVPRVDIQLSEKEAPMCESMMENFLLP